MSVLLHAHWHLVESIEILIQAIRICTGKVTSVLIVVSQILRPEDVATSRRRRERPVAQSMHARLAGALSAIMALLASMILQNAFQASFRACVVVVLLPHR